MSASSRVNVASGFDFGSPLYTSDFFKSKALKQ